MSNTGTKREENLRLTFSIDWLGLIPPILPPWCSTNRVCSQLSRVHTCPSDPTEPISASLEPINNLFLPTSLHICKLPWLNFVQILTLNHNSSQRSGTTSSSQLLRTETRHYTEFTTFLDAALHIFLHEYPLAKLTLRAGSVTGREGKRDQNLFILRNIPPFVLGVYIDLKMPNLVWNVANFIRKLSDLVWNNLIYLV